MIGNDNIFELDFPRTVMLEKVHPFVSIIMKSLDCELMDMELYFHNNNFIIYQESKLVGEKIYGKDFSLSRFIYFNMKDLKTLEAYATYPGIIGRSDWFWLASQCFNHYICKLRSYMLTTGLLFIHNSTKFHIIKCLIEKEPLMSNAELNLSDSDYLISNDLPVRKCNLINNDFSENKFIIKNILMHSEPDSFYYKDAIDVSAFKREIKWWLEGRKNIMKTRIDMQREANNY